MTMRKRKRYHLQKEKSRGNDVRSGAKGELIPSGRTEQVEDARIQLSFPREEGEKQDESMKRSNILSSAGRLLKENNILSLLIREAIYYLACHFC